MPKLYDDVGAYLYYFSAQGLGTWAPKNLCVEYAGGGIRTHEPLRDEVLSLAPLTRLGYPRILNATQKLYFKVSIYVNIYASV